MVDEDHHEDPGDLKNSSANGCGSAHMKAMVSDSQCTAAFGCRLADPDEFKPARKTCKIRRFCDADCKHVPGHKDLEQV